MAALVRDEVLVRDAQAEDETVGRELGGRLPERFHGHCIAGVDVRDSGGEDHAFRAGREESDLCEGVAPDGLGDPERRVAPVLTALDEVDGVRR